MLSELGFPPHSPSIHDDGAGSEDTQAQDMVSVYQSPKGGWTALLAVRDRLANTGDMRRSYCNDHTKHGALPGRPVYQSHPSIPRHLQRKHRISFFLMFALSMTFQRRK